MSGNKIVHTVTNKCGNHHEYTEGRPYTAQLPSDSECGIAALVGDIIIDEDNAVKRLRIEIVLDELRSAKWGLKGSEFKPGGGVVNYNKLHCAVTKVTYTVEENNHEIDDLMFVGYRNSGAILFHREFPLNFKYSNLYITEFIRSVAKDSLFALQTEYQLHMTVNLKIGECDGEIEKS